MIKLCLTTNHYLITPRQTRLNHYIISMVPLSDFQKLDIRIGTIVEAAPVEGSEKLLRLMLDFGDEKRQIVAGIAAWYTPEALLQKQIPVIVNLEPRMIKGVESQGMILAADDEGRAILLAPEEHLANGSKVR